MTRRQMADELENDLAAGQVDAPARDDHEFIIRMLRDEGVTMHDVLNSRELDVWYGTADWIRGMTDEEEGQ